APLPAPLPAPLSDGSASGEYWLSLAAFGDESQPEGRLRVSLPGGAPDGAPDVQVGLGPIAINAR
ncbi:MAG: hypothetical protein SF029_11620, partial [bacterium]|nr:hypothetical protein [bacterium]